MNLRLLTISFLLSLTTVAQMERTGIAINNPEGSSADSLTAGSTPTSFQSLNFLLSRKQSGKIILDYSSKGRPVNAWYFSGTSGQRALVIGGMHGSELSAVEIAKELIEILGEGSRPFYDVIVIPSLFPDNVVAALKTARQEFIEGRYSSGTNADPNRQMPPLGSPFKEDQPIDKKGREIEKENRVLLQLIQDFRPTRIINLHAIKNESKAGIYADPRADCNNIALGFESDSSLVIEMAQWIQARGGKVSGNNLEKKPTALYHLDPPIAQKGNVQKRNTTGSPLLKDRGEGISLGGWASTAVCEGDSLSRNAIRLVTVEFPGYRSSDLYSDKKMQDLVARNILLYSEVIRRIFLEDKYVE